MVHLAIIRKNNQILKYNFNSLSVIVLNSLLLISPIISQVKSVFKSKLVNSSIKNNNHLPAINIPNILDKKLLDL
jgi:hypothetical protein